MAFLPVEAREGSRVAAAARRRGRHGDVGEVLGRRRGRGDPWETMLHESEGV